MHFRFLEIQAMKTLSGVITDIKERSSSRYWKLRNLKNTLELNNCDYCISLNVRLLWSCEF
jgi:hypothetical protein